MRRISNKAEAVITAFVIAAVAVVVWLIVPELFPSFESGPQLFKCMAIGLGILVFLHLIVALTLTGRKKVYEALKAQGDELCYEVGHAPLFRVHFLGLAGAEALTGLLYVREQVDIPLISGVTLCMLIILLIIFGVWFWAIRTSLNSIVLVGNNLIAISNAKGKIGVFSINEVQSVNVRHRRKAVITRVTFVFPNGYFSVNQEDGFYAKCLIAKLKDVCERRNSDPCEVCKESFENNGKKYIIEHSCGREIDEATEGEINWEYDRAFEKLVKSDAVITAIGLFVIEGLIFGIIYGFLYVWTNNNSIVFTIWLLASLTIYIRSTASEFARCFGKIYKTNAIVVKKYAIVSKYSSSVVQHFLDLETSDGKGLHRVICNEPVYRQVCLNKTNLRLSKTGSSHASVYYDNDDFGIVNS